MKTEIDIDLKAIMALRGADDARSGWPSASADPDGTFWSGGNDVHWAGPPPSNPGAILAAIARWRRGEGPRPSRATTYALGAALLVALTGLDGDRANPTSAAAAAALLDGNAPGFVPWWLRPVFELDLLNGASAEPAQAAASGGIVAAAEEASASARISGILAVVRVAAVRACDGDALRSLAATAVIEDFRAVQQLQATAAAAASTDEMLAICGEIQKRRAALTRLIDRLDQMPRSDRAGGAPATMPARGTTANSAPPTPGNNCRSATAFASVAAGPDALAPESRNELRNQRTQVGRPVRGADLDF